MDRLSEALVPRIGRYEVAGRLATGGMAEILLGRLLGPSGFERPVVIKRILSHLASDPSFVAMFLDEARIAVRVRHPNVVQVYELLHEGDELAIVMEYLEGETLSVLARRLSARGKRLDPALAAHVIAEAASGLHVAHELKDDAGAYVGLVHRDVSPQNIFIGYDGSVKVLDFGIATAADRSTRTETGQLKGKFEYMSPEQCAAKKLDRRSDVFALGAVLFEISTAHRLFKRPNQLLVLKAILEEPIRPPSSVDPKFSQVLEPIIVKALAKRRAERYQSAAELRQALVVASRALDPMLVFDTALGNLMRELFADRMSEKAEMLRRLRSGTTITHIPNTDAEAVIDLPMLVDDATLSPTGASEVGVVTQPDRSARPRRRGFALGLVALLLVAGVALAFSFKRPKANQEPQLMATSAPALPSVAPAAALVMLEIDSIPSGAEVWLDGSIRGTTPFELELSRSEQAVSLELRLAGYLPLTERVVPDKAQRLKLTLARRPARARAAAAPVTPKPKPVPSYHRVQ